MSYRIVTDSGCDLSLEMYEKLDLVYVPLCLNFRGGEHHDLSEDFIKELYNAMRGGETASTAAINPSQWEEALAPVLAGGEDALVMTFSSGLSTTYQSAVIASQELKEKYPDRKVCVVDTLCASRGQGMLVWLACGLRDAGMSLEALYDWCESHKLNLCHWFTVDDLVYLKRGGRVSAATALLGSMLNIKPVLHVDNEGHLVSVSKVRGRKASIEAIAKKMGETGLPGENDTVFICHGDCLEDAKYLEKLVKEMYGVKEVRIYYTGAVIGSHSGPGTLALFYMGEHR